MGRTGMRATLARATAVAVLGVLPLAGCFSAPSAAPVASAPPALPVVDYQEPAPTEVAPLRGTTVPAGSLVPPGIRCAADTCAFRRAVRTWTPGVQLGAVNAVVLRVAIDWTCGEVPKTVMGGTGEAWVSTGGVTLHGAWTKESATAPVAFVDDRGFPIRLGAGSTPIELLPDDGTISFTPWLAALHSPGSTAKMD